MALPTEEDLRNLAPEERIKCLKELAEARKKELEDTRKKVEEELAAAEQLVKRSEDEMDEEEQAIDEAREKLRELRFDQEESLEARLAREQAEKNANQAQAGRAYEQPSDLYRVLPEMAGEIADLAGQNYLSQEQRDRLYNLREQVERFSEYHLSDRLGKDLGLLSEVIKERFDYRR